MILRFVEIENEFIYILQLGKIIFEILKDSPSALYTGP